MLMLYFACVEMGNKDVDDEQDDSVEDVSFPETGIMEGITEAHNVIRRAHGVDELTWDESLVVVSEEWIAHLDSNNNCNMEHNWDSPLGENLFWANYETTNQAVVDSWASEEQHYDYDSNSCAANEMCGHYTQIVWYSTERVGCAMMECANGAGYLWMCNYDPAGNWGGEKPY